MDRPSTVIDFVCFFPFFSKILRPYFSSGLGERTASSGRLAAWFKGSKILLVLLVEV